MLRHCPKLPFHSVTIISSVQTVERDSSRVKTQKRREFEDLRTSGLRAMAGSSATSYVVKATIVYILIFVDIMLNSVVDSEQFPSLGIVFPIISLW
jgi:hypothetical protein